MTANTFDLKLALALELSEKNAKSQKLVFGYKLFTSLLHGQNWHQVSFSFSFSFSFSKSQSNKPIHYLLCIHSNILT